MSAVNNPASKVFGNYFLNKHLSQFMEIDDLERVKFLSKAVSQPAIREVLRERVYRALPEDCLWRSIGGKNALKGVRIRNFSGPIPLPLSNYLGRCMAGFEKVDGAFRLYQMERDQDMAIPRCPCCPVWVQYQEVVLSHAPAIPRFDKEHVWVELRGGRGPSCCEAVRFLSLSCFAWCCFKPASSRFGWLATFYSNGGVVPGDEPLPRKKEKTD